GRWLNIPDRPWFNPGLPPPAASPAWPSDVLARLSSQLADEFAFHMAAGENLPEHQARKRYIPSIVRLRPNNDGREHTEEKPLDDLLTREGIQLLIVGSGGHGKTTMLKRAAAEGARRAVQDSRSPVCIYFRLASFDREGDFDLLLDRLSIAAGSIGR